MDDSKAFQVMLDKAGQSESSVFKDFDRTKNVQDQLQAMIKRHPTRFAEDFDRFVCNDNTAWNDNVTMEQLWLSFVMREKFNKKWDGTNWI